MEIFSLKTSMNIDIYLSNMVNPLSSKHGIFLLGLMAATAGFPPAPSGLPEVAKIHALDYTRPSLTLPQLATTCTLLKLVRL